jgi:anti-sigma factor RsiW
MIQPTFDHTDELLAGYVLGDLTPDEQVTVEQYLAQNPDAIAQVEQLRSTLNLLSLAGSAASLPTAEADSLFSVADPVPSTLHSSENSTALPAVEASGPSPALRDRILHAAEPAPEFKKRRFSDRQLWSLGGGIAAVALFGLGVGNYRLHQELITAQQKVQKYEGAIAILQQPQNRLVSLQAVSTTESPSGSLVLAPKGDIAMLTLQNLKPLPSGMVYRMWAFSGNGEKFNCATFTPNAMGQVFLTLPMSSYWAEATTIVINLEPMELTESTQPKAVPVLTSESL